MLIFLAMPLKYIFGESGPVFYVGITHGSLFLCYLVGSLVVSHKHEWSVLNWFVVFMAGVIPFGFLLIDKRLQDDDYGRNPADKNIGSELESIPESIKEG